MSPAELHFLGTSDSKGVPRFWCGCAVCQEARTTAANRRTRSSALVRHGADTLLLDCGPDLHAQLARLDTPLIPSAVLISHAHNDHMLGLGDLLDYVGYAGGRLNIYAPEKVIPQLQERFTYAFRGNGFHRAAPVQPLPPQGLDVCGYTVRAFEVPHGANGTSHAFRFDSPTHRWVYMTDALDVPADIAACWLSNLHLLVLGASFYDESAAERKGRSVYDVLEALRLPWARAAGHVLLSHLSHDVDVRQPLPGEGFRYAREGLCVELG
ncbi:MBL fold metallo-hydrolase [Deinococcus sp. KNUC1210]|uniref:MBL fold metallo-hydrolase n=1 Tax=Deinococcus sp. KNUC1210 TaxID=2917691 RepID=UPI001EF15A19|nr:MBL fold metallo-hydrolase [Deinococcus sp. KNUC1210]ULH15430.1 MBL fold metallo-hydrolase [Deinococcus sp. KNUC1210]